MSIPMEGNGTDATSVGALETLREDADPEHDRCRWTASSAYVTGMTAGSEDFNEQMQQPAPIVFAFVLGLAFMLLMVTFRSIVIALKAIVLNLLSVGAAYGVLVWVFQDGHGEALLGLRVQRRHRLLAAAVPVRPPVRPLDGLPRVHPQPDPRGVRPRHDAPRTRSPTGSSPRPAS